MTIPAFRAGILISPSVSRIASGPPILARARIHIGAGISDCDGHPPRSRRAKRLSDFQRGQMSGRPFSGAVQLRPICGDQGWIDAQIERVDDITQNGIVAGIRKRDLRFRCVASATFHPTRSPPTVPGSGASRRVTW